MLWGLFFLFYFLFPSLRSSLRVLFFVFFSGCFLACFVASASVLLALLRFCYPFAVRLLSVFSFLSSLAVVVVLPSFSVFFLFLSFSFLSFCLLSFLCFALQLATDYHATLQTI